MLSFPQDVLTVQHWIDCMAIEDNKKSTYVYYNINKCNMLHTEFSMHMCNLIYLYWTTIQ